MKSHFSSDFFAGNRQRLRELFRGTAPIVITANGLLQRGADSTYNFSQDANFWYLTGIDEPDLVLVMDRSKEYLIVPSRSASRQTFDGAVETGPLTRRSGISEVYEGDAGWHQLSGRIKKVKHVAALTPPPAYVEQYGLYTNPARAAMLDKLKSYNSNVETLDINAHLARLRMVKQPAELAALRQAIEVTANTIKEVAKPSKLSKFSHEYEIEAEISRGFRASGAKGHAFEPIVASGPRACTLHNVANEGELSADELVILDVGAEIEHYAADITRTRSLGQPSRRQQAVHSAVLDVQQFALSCLKPGVLLKEYEQKVETYMGEQLRRLGLINSTSHEEVRMYYPHATSHFLGLNVHDVGDYERPLEPGVVLTCEPGIYISKESIGIRIEDDILITSDGHEVLSKKLDKDL